MASMSTAPEAVAIAVYLAASVAITLSPFMVSDVMLGAIDTVIATGL